MTFATAQPVRGMLCFGSGPGCSGPVEVATQDQGAGTTNHTIAVQGNDMPGTAGNNGIIPGLTYWYETMTSSSSGQVVDDNNGHCYQVTVP